MHQHADDTTMHAKSPSDAQKVLDSSVGLHCAATGARLQRSKSQALALGSLSHVTGPDPVTGITFAAPGGSVKHLGIPLSNQPAAAATVPHTAIVTWVEACIARLSGFRLSMLGRAYVAKQVQASMVTYHATFMPVPRELLKRLCRAIHTFAAANRPVTGSGSAAALFPDKATCFRAGKGRRHCAGGPQRPHLGTPGKVLGRLLEPEQLAWKAFFDFWLHRSAAWLAAQAPASLSARHQHTWQLGRFLLFSCFPAERLQAPVRVRQYVHAYQKLQPHQRIQPDELSLDAVFCEPLFFNRQLTDAGGQPLALARLGSVRVSHLRDLLSGPEHQHSAIRHRLPTLLAALSSSWKQVIQSQPAAALWLACPDPVERRVWSRTAAGHTIQPAAQAPSCQQTTEHRSPSQQRPCGWRVLTR